MNKDEDETEKTSDRCCPKSPVTIQEWVDSISLHKSEEEVESSKGRVERSKLELDTLHLGAEAGQTAIKCVQYDASAQERRANLIQMKEKTSLQSDISSQSASSISSSIETLLESRREDPEEILLNLGFGGHIGSSDPLARIPKRFLKPSEVKGNCLDQFVRQQEELLDALDSGFCGYRGLSGFLREYQRPVGIVGKILDKIRADRSSSGSPTCSMTSFSEVAFSVLAVNSFRNALMRSAKRQVDSPGGSILEPANREFLENQGERDGNGRRLILGQDEYRVDGDGGLVQTGKVVRAVLSRRRTASLVFEDEDVGGEEKKSVKSLWSVYKQLKSKDESVDDGNLSAGLSRRRCSVERVLVRQNSICIEGNEALLSQDFIDSTEIQPGNEENVENDEENQSMCTLPVTNDEKLSTYKESFELEELPSHAEDNVDEQAQEEERRYSALSDSSGFLDGETTELLQLDESRVKVTQSDDRSNDSNPPRLVRPEPVRLCAVSSDCEEKSYDESERENLVSKNTFRPINATEIASSVPEFRLVVSDHDAGVNSEDDTQAIPLLSLESVEKAAFYRSEVHLSINPDEKSQENANLTENPQETLEIPPCLNVSVVSRVAEATRSQEVDEEVTGRTRRRSLVTTTTLKTQELVVTPQMSPQVSPRASPNTFQEEDEYYDLQRLLCTISGGEIQSKLTRQEFFSKPIKERTRVEAIALQMALKKYQQSLNNDQSSLNKYRDECDPDQRHELKLLRDLHAGICKEVAQLQLLLKSRIQNVNKSKFLPLSIRLIRQFSLLLHQQNFLCQQLERLKRQESKKEKSVEKFEFSRKSPVDETRYKIMLDNFQDRLYTDLQRTVHEENASLKQELEHNRKELREIKSLLKQLVSKHSNEAARTLGDPDTPLNEPT